MVNASRLALEAGGLTVDLSDHLDRSPTGGGAVMDGFEGLGFAPVSARFFEGAGDGATYRGSRVLPRDLSLPLIFSANDRRALQTRVSRLARVLSPALAPATLKLTEPDGTGWTAQVVRTGAGDEDTDGETYYAVTLALRAGDPYWTATRAEEKVITSAGAGRGLLRGPLSALRLRSGQVLGEALIENTGDAPAFPLVTVRGPAKSLILRSPSGETLTWSGDLPADEVRIFDHQAKTITDGDGANRYAELGPAPRFWAVPPGAQTAEVQVEGSSIGTVQPDGSVTGRTSVSLSWRPRRWLML